MLLGAVGCNIDVIGERHPGSAISQRTCGRAVLSQATEGAGEHAVAICDGQVEKLRRRPPEHYAFRGSQHGTLREQSG